MDDLHLSLSPALAAFVDEQVAGGDYADPAAYVAALIDAEARARAQARLDEFLREGLKGKPTPWTQGDSDRLIRLATTGE